MGGTTLVLGATGRIGGQVARVLQARGVRHRATFRRLPAPIELAFDVCAFDYDDARTWEAALTGVERMLVVTAPIDPWAAERIAPFLAAAAQMGVRRAVYVSALVADGDPRTASYAAAEQAVRDSGVAWTIVRPNWFMQDFAPGFLLPFLQVLGSIPVDAGDARVSFVDADDVAAAAAELLTGEGHVGETVTLCGPEALTLGEVADEISRCAGRALPYAPRGDEPLLRVFRDAGWPPERVALLGGLIALMREGRHALLAPDLEAILGRAPSSFSAYAERHATAWQA